MQKNYTIEEAAEILRLPVATVRKHQYEIGFSKLGRRLIFREDDLDKWIESKRHKPNRELRGE